MGIRTPDQRLRVFVSSTLGELAEERQAVERAIMALRLTPVMLELGARPHPPRELYRAYLAQSDVFIGLYWQGYGRVGAGMEVSSLEEEFDLARDMPRLLYVKLPAPDREPRLDALVARIRQEAAYRKFRSARELGRLVRDDLATLLSERFAAGRSQATASPPAAEPPLPPRRPRPPPVGSTSLVGRERAIEEAARLVEGPEARLVTLTGPGGVGKTRLAIAVAERLRDRFDSVAFAPLSMITEPELVLGGIGRAVGADLSGASEPLEALIERLGDGRWLLLLDNLEQVVDSGRDLDELLDRCRGLEILATSRTLLGLRGEREYPIPPLPLPESVAAEAAAEPVDTESLPLEELMSSPAVALFVDRARAVRHDFALTRENAAAVVEICRRLEGLPLAIELAAARIRLRSPRELLARLASSFDSLGTGAVDMPERQRTLRATVEWSVGLLDEAERSLLETVAVFVGGWTVDAAATVAGIDDDRALDLSEALARHSLIQLGGSEHGPRLRMLDTVRAFVAERLAARPDAGGIGRRHADYYRALAEEAEPRLRHVGHSEWFERLDADAGNLAAAVRWYLANDPTSLPHLFRVLWMFWELRDYLGEARAWIEQLLPGAGSLGPQARADLLWVATATSLEVGDDVGAAASHGLAPLIPQIDDPLLRALSQLAMAWAAPIGGRFDAAIHQTLLALEEFRRLQEPYWTTVALLTAGHLEISVRRNDDSERHLLEGRALADRFGYGWLSAWSRVQLGTLALTRGQLDDAWALLDEGLGLSLATHSIRNLSLSLAAIAQFALAEGNAERAALLEGATEGLRQRVGLRPWPMLRRDEDELADQVREALGPERFDQVFAAGTHLSRRAAVAAVHDRGDAGTRAS